MIKRYLVFTDQKSLNWLIQEDDKIIGSAEEVIFTVPSASSKTLCGSIEVYGNLYWEDGRAVFK